MTKMTLLALGVTPWTVGKNLPENRRADRDALQFVVVEAHREPFDSPRGASGASVADYSPRISATVEVEVDATAMFEPNNRDIVESLADDLVGLRLSLVGLGLPAKASTSRQRRKTFDHQGDQLHSELYSSVLETVRVQLIERVPRITEDMISRAIINAFAHAMVLPRSGRDATKGGEAPKNSDLFQVKADHLGKALVLAELIEHKTKDTHCKKIEEFLQEVLDDVFLQIRREELLSSKEVVGAVLAVVSILQLAVDEPFDLPQDTIILVGLPGSATRHGLGQCLSGFGVVNEVAISCRDHGFAYCRFDEEAAAQRAVAGQSSLTIEDAQPRLYMLREGRSTDFTDVRSGNNVLPVHVGKPSLPPDEKDTSPVCVSKHSANVLWRLGIQQELVSHFSLRSSLALLEEAL